MLDGLSLNLAPDSPVTPYTGRSATVYDLLPMETVSHQPGGGSKVPKDPDEDTLVDRASSMRKGKGKVREVVFDSQEEDPRRREVDEELGENSLPVHEGRISHGGTTISVGVGNGGSGKQCFILFPFYFDE